MFLIFQTDTQKICYRYAIFVMQIEAAKAVSAQNIGPRKSTACETENRIGISPKKSDQSIPILKPNTSSNIEFFRKSQPISMIRFEF